MLERHNVEAAREGVGTEWKHHHVRQGVEPTIVPGSVTNREVHGAVSLVTEEMCVAALARSGIQNPRSGRQIFGELGDGVFDNRFEVEDVAAERARERFGQRAILHVRCCASIITVEPARNAASERVKGREAKTIEKYSASFSKRSAGPSFRSRIARAMGSSEGARLVARPAGLSRNEKYFRRTTSN